LFWFWVQAKKKQKKDPNAPKRPQSAFLLFSNSERANVRADNPEFKLADIGRELGVRWKALSES
jgi:hypothetical protein